MSCSGTTSSGGGRRGFVLATTLLVTTLLTVMLAAAFLLASAEQRMTDNSFGTARALAIAQAGLQNYYAQGRSLDTSSTYDSVRVTENGGYADVVSRRLRSAGGTIGSALALWVVRSSGVATTGVLAGQVQGSRTIAQLAQFNPGKLPARAAVVALNGVSITGPGGQTYPVSGHDLNPDLCSTNPGGRAADTSAVSVPVGLYSTSQGTPGPGQQSGIQTVESAPFPLSRNLYDSTHVDWAGLLGGNFLPDYTVPPGPWPVVNGNTYSVGYVNGDVTLPTGMRRGMLVVTGNVTVVSGVHWDGIILVGGALNLQPASLTNYNIHGMIVTGLNTALGQAVPTDNLKYGAGANGLAQIAWTWCYAQAASNALSSLVPIQGAWTDAWATY